MTAPIVTVTLNPAIDQTLILDHLTLGEANHVVESRTDPGGKGINVSRVLRELGGSPSPRASRPAAWAALSSTN